jgi:hypothetical protein
MAWFAGEVGLPGYSAYSSSKRRRPLADPEPGARTGARVDNRQCDRPAYVKSAMGVQALEQSAAASGISVGEAQAQRDGGIPLRRQASAREGLEHVST